MADELDAASLEAMAEGTGTGSEQQVTETVNDSQQTTEQIGEQETQTANTQEAVKWTDAEVPPELANLYKVKTMGELQKFIADRDQKYRGSSGEARRLAEELKAIKAAQQQGQPKQTPDGAQSSMGNFFGFRDQNEYNEAFKLDPIKAAQRVQQAIVTNAREEMKKDMADRFKPLEEKERQLAMEGARREAFERYPEFAKGQPWHDMTASYFEQNPELADALETLAGKTGVNVTELAGKLATYDILKAQLATATGQKQQRGKAAAVGTKPGTGGKTVPKQDSYKDAIAHAAAADGIDQSDAEAFADRLSRM